MNAPQAIARLDHDPSNNDEDNLAFLCFDHHDQFDSTTSQAKGLTVDEVKHSTVALYELHLTEERRRVGRARCG